MTVPVILQDCTTPTKAGGIWTYIRLLGESPLMARYQQRVTVHPRSAVGVNVRAAQALARDMRAAHADVAHLHGLQTGGLYAAIAARLAGIRRTVMAVHASEEDNVFTSRRRRCAIRHAAEPASLRMTSASYCVSAFGSAKPFIARSARHFLGHIPNGIPLPDSPVDAAAVRTALGVPADRVVALFSARLTVDKGILDLVDACDLLNSAVRERLTVLIAGDGPHREQLERRVSESGLNGLIRLLGWRTDTEQLLAACDFFVLPSLHENQSYSILEAMAAGKAVISTLAGGTPEIVVDGVTGLLVPPCDPASLGAAIASLAANPDQSAGMGASGRDRVRTHFSMEALARRLGNVYDELLALPSGRT